MDLTTLIKAIVEIGITPVLLLLFVKYFFDRDKDRDKARDGKMDELYTNFRERENILIAEGARREELLRSEADKREKLIRQEADKREGSLMSTIEGFSRTMEKISDTMNEIQKSSILMQQQLNSVEGKLERMEKVGNERTGHCTG